MYTVKPAPIISATTDPSDAIDNADSHEYYSENTPVRPCDSGVSVVVGSIWKYTGTPCSGNSCPGWQKLDNNAATVRIAAGWWQALPTAQCRARSGDTPEPPAAAIPAPGGRWWTTTRQQHRHRRPTGDQTVPTAQRRQDLALHRALHAAATPAPAGRCWDNNPATSLPRRRMEPNLYQLHNTGKIWRFTGTACSGKFLPWLANVGQ